MVWLNTLWHAASGGIASACSITLLYPLETARTRQQVENENVTDYSFKYIHNVYKQEGISGLFRGWVSLVITQFVTSAIYFYVFHGLKGAGQLGDVIQQTMTKDLLFGCLAGIIAVLFTNPLWVINTRLKLQGAKLTSNVRKANNWPVYDGMYDCGVQILRCEGWMSLWSGLLPSLVLVCNPAIHFMTYEFLKRQTLILLNQEVLTGLLAFMYGAISKAVATVTTYPLQVIQTRVRAGSRILPESYHLLSFAAVQHYFRGLEAKMTQTVLNSALMFLFYEKIRYAVIKILETMFVA